MAKTDPKQATSAPKDATITPRCRLKLTVNVNVRNTHDLAEKARRIMKETREGRARNTSKNYDPKQLEFIEWCKRREFEDGSTVHQDKLGLFLEEEVAKRALRRRGKKSDAAEEIDLEQQTLSHASVRTYVSAITDLWAY